MPTFWYSVSYCYYPIQRGRNDLLTRRISPQTFARLDFGSIPYPRENPILEDPIGAARELVREESTGLLKNLAFRFEDVVLCREFYMLSLTSYRANWVSNEPYKSST